MFYNTVCCHSNTAQTLFIESYVDDEAILRDNARNVKISSPDVSIGLNTSRYLADNYSSPAWNLMRLPSCTCAAST